jgi:murein DD-endopeptidase MepM/ murein hydrolase activator NlpD
MNVLVSHACNRFTAYLHLGAVSVTAGQVLAAGDLIGQSGMTGASTPHLHLTYMLGQTGTANDERKSHNPRAGRRSRRCCSKRRAGDLSRSRSCRDQCFTGRRITIR